ncbi:MAG: hypothetical protein IT450_19135 [Phycisphaerales bacterium]|nr:hypothetical protein [Phycisphaerales bacterium]
MSNAAVRSRALALCSALFLAASAALGQSDSCAAAPQIVPGSYSGSTAGATNDGSADCGQAATAPDVWVRFIASEACLATVDTCGSAYDTVLSLHTGCPGTTENQLACNDDSCALGSRVVAALSAGQEIWIRISGFNGATGAFTLNLACTPAFGADACADAEIIGDGEYSGTTALATNDGTCSCGEAAASPDVWFAYQADRDMRLTVATCNSGFDTVLSAHSGCPDGTANELACNDDTCALGSRVVVNLAAGEICLLRVAGYNGATGAFSLQVSSADPGPEGADAYIGELTTMGQYGRVGSVIGCAIDTPLCNAGTTPLDWYNNPDPRHPFMAFNFYRRTGNRLEQIGMSWVKHGFAAAQANACGFGCTPNGDSTRLGVGCSDTYSAGLNADQRYLGPRGEINPWTGAFTYEGSHLSQGNHAHNAIDHRLQINDADLSSGPGTGSEYLCEVYIVCHDDINPMNSIAWEPTAVSGSPGGTWQFNIAPAATRVGPAIESLSTATRITIPPTPVDDGRCILAADVIDLGGGMWRYEYALFNLDMDRGVQAISFPLPESAAFSNVGFHAPTSHGEGLSNAPWTTTRTADRLIFATQTYAANPQANAVRWGTLYNFSFDADVAPGTGAVELALFKPGTPTSLVGSGIPVPGGAPPCVGDVDGDRDVDLSDLAVLLSHFGTPGGAGENEGDLDGDGDVDLTDLSVLLNRFGLACP